LIVYYSRFGVVKRLAECVAAGATREAAARVDFLEVGDQPLEELRRGEDQAGMVLRRAAVVNQLSSADALIVGAPGYFGSMASPIKRLFEDCVTASNPPMTDRTRPWRHYLFQNKVGAAFIATATPHGGNEQAIHSILTMFMHLGFIVVTPGQREPILENESAPYGATAISGPDGDRPPTEAEEEGARYLGHRVAEVTTWLKTGWLNWNRQRDLLARTAALGSERPI
jgi:NAD(P)H dehydrogenase (quinone)